MLRQRRRIGHAGKIMGFEGPKPSIGHAKAWDPTLEGGGPSTPSKNQLIAPQ